MDSKTVIAERTLYSVDKDGVGRDLRLLIGKPYKTDTQFGDWACPVALEGLHGTFPDMYGVDSWQALMIARELIGRMLSYFVHGGGTLYWERDGEAISIEELFGVAYLDPDTPETIAAQPEDGPMSDEQSARVAALTDDDISQIDTSILKHCTHQYRKLVLVIGKAMDDSDESLRDVPDLFYAERIKEIVREGKLESQGDLNKMRFSEVRRPDL